MEEISPAVTVSLGSLVCESSGISNHVEITRLKLLTEAASLLSDPHLVPYAGSNSSWNESFNATKVAANRSASSVSAEIRGNPNLPQMVPSTRSGQIACSGLIQEIEDEEISSVTEDANGINTEELLPRDAASEISLPISVEIEGIDNGQLVAKVIILEKGSCDRKRSHDQLTAVDQLNEESSARPLEASAVALPLPNANDPAKGDIKSVFELDCVPLWGFVSICGKRAEMEDTITVAPHFMKIPFNMFIGKQVVDGLSRTLSHLTSHFFGVYDGHGGSQVAKYCSDRIHCALAEELDIFNEELVDGSTRDIQQVLWEKVFSSCFLRVDDEVGGKVSRFLPEESLDVLTCTSGPIAPETAGSTAVVAVLSSSHIIVANCGDSRAVLCRGKEAVALSVDHKPNREDEYTRIEASGGKVICWNGHRVFGVLAMSRSIGDRYLKPWIIPDPEVVFVPRAREDECLVLASDGLWDVMTNEEVCEVARRRILLWHKRNGSNPLPERGEGVDLAAQAAAEYLSMLALQKGSNDNISVIVVDLKARRKSKSKP